MKVNTNIKYDILIKCLHEYVTELYKELANTYKKHIKKTRRYELKDSELDFYRNQWKQIYIAEQCIKSFEDPDVSKEEKEEMYKNIIENNFKNI